MFSIKTLADLQGLPVEQEGHGLTLGLLRYLRSFFLELYEAFSEGQSLEAFTLEPHGYFMILERVAELRLLYKEDPLSGGYGLLKSRVEYVERLACEDGSEWFKVALLDDHDFMMFYFLSAQNLSEEEEAFLCDDSFSLF